MTDTSTRSPREGGDLEAILAEAARLLPEQAPLHTFVHHNTLHHWESRPFDEAIEEACHVLGTEGYQTEAQFRRHLETGRILDRDLAAVVEERAGSDRPLFEGGPTLRTFEHFRLRHLFEVPSGATIEWHLREGHEGSRLRSEIGSERRRCLLESGREEDVVARIWTAFERLGPLEESRSIGPRWRDRLLSAFGEDTDLRVHPLLIRLAGAYLDQGIAYWTMPQREEGMLRCVRKIYALPYGSPARWRSGIAKELRRQEREGWSAIETIAWALAEGGVSPQDRYRFIADTLLSLRGWAGMAHQLERYPDRAPVAAPAIRLRDHLAVELVLDLFAARTLVRQRLGESASLSEVCAKAASTTTAPDRRLVYEAFVLAQLSDVPLDRFQDPEVASRWMTAVADFDETRRRQRLHLAYERRHRMEVLDALETGRSRAVAERGAPRFQAIFCIDDREESIRRHLEEIEPRVETFGYAGFFGVAMHYTGLEDVRSRPLCPVVVRPGHTIRETAEAEGGDARYKGTRRLRAVVQHATRVGATTLIRGGMLAPLIGPLSIVPLVGRALFPRLAHHVKHGLESLGQERPRTRLQVEEQGPTDVESAVRQGYRVHEMADIVESALRTMGLDATRAPLVVVVGHGSSSLNNPHEAAHDCGATGGGRGGPNARAFAVMANHGEVRRMLRERGIEIPPSTWFVGAYHNTCDDSIELYDVDLVPPGARATLAIAHDRLDEACRAEARERCRRFETAPLHLSLDRALSEVQERAVDLAQPRPEYGHATNSICIVGRRSLTRGLFLDRRAFLVSYDPETDPEGELLAPLLLSVGPVGAGINLEYYFSFVDPLGFGCGTKLPHNISALLGVMDGHASDLRTGLPWQMVEIHEPVRLLIVVDAARALLGRIVEAHPELGMLVSNGWVQLVAREPDDGELWTFEADGFRRYQRDALAPAPRASSYDYFAGERTHLPPVWMDPGEGA